MKHHTYRVQVDWTGNDGRGTKNYKDYRRDHIIASEGKPEIQGSSDPSFRGDATCYNPEDLLVASLAACHMLWYLHLCSVNRVSVFLRSFSVRLILSAGCGFLAALLVAFLAMALMDAGVI
ncbi:MAG: hypothetical protein DMG34_07280 [Acidobacteria bacterium]|nr:MAG: hypothetical protein DMG34_07280 [Acidobacteriota bacterium]